MLEIQKDLNEIQVGVDEAGRGCLAGPVVAAAVIIGKKNGIPSVDDSKKLRPKKRQELSLEIKSSCEVYAIGLVEPEEIDEINILNASFLAMHRALDQLKVKFERILVDGNRFNAYRKVKHDCIIRGDGKYQCIAAASILAKEHRDSIMRSYDEDFPGYGWSTNFGYPTVQHRKAIAELGVTSLHRKSFTLLPSQISLFN